MKGLTDEKLEEARSVLDEYKEELLYAQFFNTFGLERDLSEIWEANYRELQNLLIELLDTEYYLVAAWYMEHGLGEVAHNFRKPLMKLYGITHDGAGDAEERRRKFWEVAFKRRVIH